MCFPKVGNVTYFKEAVLYVNIWNESSLVCCPTPPLSWYEAEYFKNVLLMNNQAEKARKHLEGGRNVLNWMKRSINKLWRHCFVFPKEILFFLCCPPPPNPYGAISGPKKKKIENDISIFIMLQYSFPIFSLFFFSCWTNNFIFIVFCLIPFWFLLLGNCKNTNKS